MDTSNDEHSPLIKSPHSSNIEQWRSKNDSHSTGFEETSAKQNNKFWSLLCLIFPILVWFPKYKRDWKDLLKYDVLAGLTAGFTIIPKNIAYATVAGLDPIYGIYASCIPSFIYFFFGSSRHLLVGPTAVISLLVADALQSENLSDSEYTRRALQMSFLAGLFCLIIGICQLGFIAKFISRPVVAGFTNASAFVICCSQVNPFLGIKSKSSSSLLYDILENSINHIEETNYICVIIGCVSLAIIVAAKKIKYAQMIPVPLFIVIIATLLTWLLKLDDHGVPIVGHVPRGFPNPDFAYFKSWNELSKALVQSILIALIALLESYSIAKTFATKYQYNIHPNQELVALGMSNFIGSFFSCYPVTGSFSGTAVNQRAGAKSGVANLICCLTVFVVMMALTFLLKYLPSTCLAAIVLSAVGSLIDIQYILFLWRTNKEDFVTLLICWVSALIVGIELGVCIGIGFSILLIAYHIAHPKLTPLGLYSKTTMNDSNDVQVVEAACSNVELESIVIIRMEAPLVFLNSETLKDALLSLAWYGTFQSDVSAWKGNKPVYNSFKHHSMRQNEPDVAATYNTPDNRPLNVLPPKIIVLDMIHVTLLDATGIEVLQELHSAMKRCNVSLLFAQTRNTVLAQLQQSQTLDKIGASNFFETVVEAATEAHKSTSSSLSVGFSVHHPVFGNVKVV